MSVKPGRAVPHVVGLLTAFAGITMLVPAAVALGYGEVRAATALAGVAAVTVLAGFGAFRATRGAASELSLRDGFAIVTLGWLSVCAFGALPYVVTGSIPSYTGAFFESMAGFTTTGATVVVDLDELPRGVVLWRSQTQWMGGMGIIVLSVAILPLLGVGGMQLLQAEIPGLAPDRLRPRVRQTASILWGVYAAITLVEVAVLWLGGMSLFQAVNHALTTMATGGFSTENASVGAFSSPFLQYAIGFFVVLAGINFTLHYSWLTGRWAALRRNVELKVYLALLAGSSLLLLALIWNGDPASFEASLRAAFFQSASIITTTGYATADYETWPVAAQTWVLVLMLIGGCAGSTAGSVKVLRYVLVAKQARVALRRLIHPRGVFVHKLDGVPVSDDAMTSVSGFLLLYLGALVVGVLALALLGLDAATALSASASSLGNVGPGLGLVGPAETYAPLPGAALWILSGLMLLGRLEIFTVLVLFTRSYWR